MEQNHVVNAVFFETHRVLVTIDDCHFVHSFPDAASAVSYARDFVGAAKVYQMLFTAQRKPDGTFDVWPERAREIHPTDSDKYMFTNIAELPRDLVEIPGFAL